MSDDETVTPGEQAQGLTPESKREQEEASGVRNVPLREANDAKRAQAAKTILDSVEEFDKPVRMRGHVHSDI
jgi:hypothetical protein